MSWGGEWGLRRVRLDQQAASSRDSLWPYSVGMLRLSWVVPPAQVEPTPFINFVCYDLPCVYVQLYKFKKFTENVVKMVTFKLPQVQKYLTDGAEIWCGYNTLYVL